VSSLTWHLIRAAEADERVSHPGVSTANRQDGDEAIKNDREAPTKRTFACLGKRQPLLRGWKAKQADFVKYRTPRADGPGWEGFS